MNNSSYRQKEEGWLRVEDFLPAAASLLPLVLKQNIYIMINGSFSDSFYLLIARFNRLSPQ